MSEMSMLETAQTNVREFVAKVRADLADLPAEDVDDLTGGLEADLAERASELPGGSDLSVAFGTPEAYAAELRAAAGLPARAALEPTSRPSVLRRIEEGARARRVALQTAYPVLRDLAPVWWLLRGFALVYLPLLLLLGSGRSLPFVLGLVGAAISFVIGRRRELAVRSWTNRLVILVGLAAVLLLPPTLYSLAQVRTVYLNDYSNSGPTLPTGSGVIVNGEMATNLYAYDAQGKRLEGVRLFNQYGQAVSISPDAQGWIFELPPEQQPTQGPDGSLSFQRGVFPVRWGSRTGWEPSTGGWEPPVQITALPPESPSPSTTASPSASPTSSADPSGAATSTPTTSPSTGASAKPSPSPSATP